MPFLHLTTFISASPDRVFDLSRSVDVHRDSMKSYDEKIINGTTKGLMNLNDTVTWTAKHFFKTRTLQVKLTQYQKPESFTDEQIRGDFRMMKHEHFFKPIENGTLLIDQFHYEIPHGIFGKLVNKIYLEKHITRLLNERNAVIKKLAEGDGWKQYLTA